MAQFSELRVIRMNRILQKTNEPSSKTNLADTTISRGPDPVFLFPVMTSVF
jgi:hypothetical protein